MKAREYLNQISLSNIKIRQYEEQLYEIQQRMYSIGSPKFDKDIVQTSSNNDAMTQYVIKCEEVEKRLLEARAYNISIIELITQQIHSLDNPIYIDILYQRYVECQRLEQIAVNKNYSYNYTRKLCTKAVRSFANTCDMDDKEQKVTKRSQNIC